jgi:hypothetical protein
MDDRTARLTKHARKRLKDRAMNTRSGYENMAERALAEGVPRGGLTGSLIRYQDYLFHRNEVVNNIRIYNYMVFLFAGNTLITVLPLPHKYYAAYDKAKRRWREQDKGMESKEV